jgi:hypothetical protein
MKYYSALKEEILSFVTTWRNLEDMLSDIRQIPHGLTYIWNLKNVELVYGHTTLNVPNLV